LGEYSPNPLGNLGNFVATRFSNTRYDELCFHFGELRQENRRVRQRFTQLAGRLLHRIRRTESSAVPPVFDSSWTAPDAVRPIGLALAVIEHVRRRVPNWPPPVGCMNRLAMSNGV